jgi:hypothetical protein
MNIKKNFFAALFFLSIPTPFYPASIDTTSISRCDVLQKHFTEIAQLPDGNNLQLMIKKYLEDTIALIDRSQEYTKNNTAFRRSIRMFHKSEEHAVLREEKAGLNDLEKTLAEREKAIADKNPATAEFISTIKKNDYALNWYVDKQGNRKILFKEYLFCLQEHQIKQLSYQSMKL